MSFLRAIEKRIRRTTLNALGNSGRIGPEDSLTISLPNKPRILLVRIDRIGDAIISTPVLNSLRTRFPQGRIDILLGEKNRMVAPLLPTVDNVYVLAKKVSGMLRTIATLRRNRYDVVVNLHLNRSASASLISGLVGGTRVIESPLDNAFADAAETHHHVVTITTRLLKPFGIGSAVERDHPLELRLPADSVVRAKKILTTLRQEGNGGKTGEEGNERRIILMNISTGHPSRNWSQTCFITAAQLMCTEGMIPVICGTPADAEQVKEVADRSGTVALPPLKSYADFAAVVAQTDGVISPETSTVHLAAALGRPTVALYASEQNAWAWRPWGVPNRVFLMEELRPEEVVAAMCELLKEYSARG